MSSEEDISTLYARDLAPTEDEKYSCLLADEHRRLVKKNHRLSEENRAMRNSLTLMFQRVEKMQIHFSSMSSLKQQNEKREENIRDLGRIFMEVVEQNKNLKDAVHISEHARQEIKAESEIQQKLLRLIKPLTQTQLIPESGRSTKLGRHAVN